MFLIYIFGDYYKDFLHFICLLSKLQYFQYSRTLIKIFSIGILFFKILYFFKKNFFPSLFIKYIYKFYENL